MPIYKTGKVKTVSGRKLQQYRVVVNYTDSNGEHKKMTGRTYGRDEANNLEKELAERVRDHCFSKRITLQQLYEEYTAAKEHEVRASTLSKTKSVLLNHVLNTELQNKRIDKITVPMLQKWKNELGAKKLKISMKNNVIRELNTLLNYAVKMEYLPKNPLKNIGKFKDAYFTAPEEKIHYYTKEQFDKYIEVARNTRRNLTDHGCYVFFYLLFYTGLRKGEMNALKWSDLEGNTLHVCRSINQKAHGYVETPPKNKSSYRDIKLPRNAMNVIEEYRAILAENSQYSESWRLCGGFKPISDTNLENHNKFYAETAGLPHIRIHDFRHSHATMLINHGISIVEVSRRLGHADTKMTLNTYAHLYPSTEEAALKLMESL